MRKKMMYTLAIVAIAGSAMVGCSNQDSGNKPPQVTPTPTVTVAPSVTEVPPSVTEEPKEEANLSPITYSNLADAKTRDLIKQQLIAKGVTEETTAVFLRWVEEYNERVGNPKAFQEGFVLADGAQVNYDDVDLEQRLFENGDSRLEVNCRLTAFLLFKDFVKFGGESIEPDNYLMFDMEAIRTEDLLKDIQKEAEKFVGLFNPVEVLAESSKDEHIEFIKKALNERKIEFTNTDGISIISLYLHDQMENKRFVGHTGVLLTTEEGYLFVEKYSADMPYQATKFKSEQEVVDYLLGRSDIYGDGTEEKPIVMKDDQVIG